MTRILSGIRPTGNLHLGNYLGSLKQWVELANEPDTECFYTIVDYHALLSHREARLDNTTLDMTAWYLAAGIDPNKSVIFAQSTVPAHTELAWIFNTLISVPELSRMTQYKSLVAQGTEQPNAALLTYPILQAADILLYKADLVPVGQDQVQHNELTRDVAREFNRLTQTEYFTEPRARLTDGALILSLDNPEKKMSKSLPSGTLALEADEATLRSRVMKAVTDSGQPAGEFPDSAMPHVAELSSEQRAQLMLSMTPGVRNLFVILKETSPDLQDYDRLLQDYRHKTLQYKDLKETVANSVVNFILPLQERYKAIRHDEATLRQILKEGSAKANEVANQTLKEAKQLLGILDLS